MDLQTLGDEIAKALARLTLSHLARDEEKKPKFTGALHELLPPGIARNARVRQLDHVADRIIAELALLIGSKSAPGRLGRIDRESAVDALTLALRRAELSRELITLDDDEVRIRERLLASRPDDEVSDYATGLFNTLLTEVSAFIAVMAARLPDELPAQDHEELRRLRVVSEEVDRALDDIPKRPVGGISPANRALNFEVAYRRAVATKFDQVVLYGVKADDRLRRYPLSVAYLTLTATVDRGATTYRIDEIISNQRRIVIRGEAGSGKTTLLHWLAVQAAQRTFSQRLDTWNSLIPLYISLREATRIGQLPSVGHFVDHGAGLHAGSEPEQWTVGHMNAGRALVLIDGLDELTKDLLAEVPAWLEQLVTEFPECVYVLTSRPSALGSLPAIADDFTELTLASMTSSDVQLFVSHWHKAVSARFATADDLTTLYHLEAELQRRLSESEELRGLARTPLLCALMCALNREAEGQVPRDRVSLYTDAIELLVARRDERRGITTDGPLSGRQTTLLLQDLAYGMLIEARSTVSPALFQDSITRSLAGMPHVRAPTDEVSDFVRARSGVVVEVAADELGFVHLSFRDFLAAQGIARSRADKRLRDEVKAQRWNEVAVFYSSFAAPEELRHLFKSLLWEAKLVDGEMAVARRVGREFLALECYGASDVVDDDITLELTARVQELVPPKSRREALLLASGGAAAVAALGRLPKELPAADVIHTIAMLASMGDEPAMETLAGWAADPRLEVRRELAAVWSSFDVRKYAESVLEPMRMAPGEEIPLVVGASDLEPLRRLEWATDVTVVGAQSALNQHDLPSGVRRLRLNSYGAGTVDVLSPDCTIETLVIHDAQQLTGISGLDLETGLVDLWLEDVPVWANLASIAAARGLKRLGISNAPRAGRALALHASLETLQLDRLPGLRELTVADPSRLASLTLVGCRVLTLPWLADAKRLRDLTVRGSGCKQLPAFDGMEQLAQVDVGENRELVSLDFLAGARNIQRLSLHGCGRIIDLSPLEGLKELRELDLSFCTKLDLEVLRALPKLRSVDLSGSPAPWSMDPIAHVEHIDLPYFEVEAG